MPGGNWHCIKRNTNRNDGKKISQLSLYEKMRNNIKFARYIFFWFRTGLFIKWVQKILFKSNNYLIFGNNLKCLVSSESFIISNLICFIGLTWNLTWSNYLTKLLSVSFLVKAKKSWCTHIFIQCFMINFYHLFLMEFIPHPFLYLYIYS